MSAPADARSKPAVTDALYKAIRKLAPSLTSLTFKGYSACSSDSNYRIFSELRALTNLESLRFYLTPIDDVTQHIRRLSKLTCLELVSCGLGRFPTALCEKPNWRVLTVQNYFRLESSLPVHFTRWRALVALDLSGSDLRSLPDNFGVLGRTLKSLDISNNIHLTQLPLSFADLTALTKLNVSDMAAVVGNTGDPAAVGSIAWVSVTLLSLRSLGINNCALRQVLIVSLPLSHCFFLRFAPLLSTSARVCRNLERALRIPFSERSFIFFLRRRCRVRLPIKDAPPSLTFLSFPLRHSSRTASATCSNSEFSTRAGTGSVPSPRSCATSRSSR